MREGEEEGRGWGGGGDRGEEEGVLEANTTVQQGDLGSSPRVRSDSNR